MAESRLQKATVKLRIGFFRGRRDLNHAFDAGALVDVPAARRRELLKLNQALTAELTDEETFREFLADPVAFVKGRFPRSDGLLASLRIHGPTGAVASTAVDLTVEIAPPLDGPGDLAAKRPSADSVGRSGALVARGSKMRGSDRASSRGGKR